MITTEPAVVFGIGQVELLDWVGQTAGTGDDSVLYFRDDLGVHALELTVAEDGTMTTDETGVLDGVHDVAASHVRPGDSTRRSTGWWKARPARHWSGSTPTPAAPPRST